MTKIYIIAGEASGDFLASQLMRSLKEQNPDCEFYGVGGALMEHEGLRPLFPMRELSVMGIAEIAPKVFSLLKRINQTVKDIEDKQPDVIITVDAPDFSFRVQKKVHKRAKTKAKQIHYVAPTVWAWRPGRAKKIAQFLDGLICLFPFEPPFFEKEGLKSFAIGHPMMQSGILEAKALPLGDPDKQKLGVFFGSRHGELNKMGPVLKESVIKVYESNRNIELIVPTLPHLREKIVAMTNDLPMTVHVDANKDQKWRIFKSCDAAIAVSGTVGLELAIANVPHLIAYKMNPITWQIIKRVIRTRFAHLANILLQKEAVPEFIQENCTADKISEYALELLENDNVKAFQTRHFDTVRKQMTGDEKASDKAAKFIYASL
ncbi:MAG: lipid-A-disaccharide synthase [Pseudomonadota bacterium]